MKEQTWPFSDPPNLAVIANRNIISGQAWIAYVSHDSDDGGWQFHTDQTEPIDESSATVVSLRNILELDSSIDQLADLPLGWYAWREASDAPWQRAKVPV